MMIPAPTRSQGREKIINYLALAKYTLALFLIRRYKNQATSKFSSPGMQSTHLIWLILSFSDELPLNKNNNLHAV